MGPITITCSVIAAGLCAIYIETYWKYVGTGLPKRLSRLFPVKREHNSMTDLEFYKSKRGGDTLDHFISAVLKIDNPEDAKRFYNGLVACAQEHIKRGEWRAGRNPVDAANSNIGWCFGEGMAPERIAMWSFEMALQIASRRRESLMRAMSDDMHSARNI